MYSQQKDSIPLRSQISFYLDLKNCERNSYLYSTVMRFMGDITHGITILRVSALHKVELSLKMGRTTARKLV